MVTIFYTLLLSFCTLYSTPSEQEMLCYQAINACRQNKEIEAIQFLKQIKQASMLDDILIIADGRNILHYMAVNNCSRAYCTVPPYSSSLPYTINFWSGTLLNKKDNVGKTPLMYVIEKGYSSLFYLLIKEKNIDLDVQDNQGKTALHYAQNAQNDIYYWNLATSGANQNIRDFQGNLPRIIKKNSHAPPFRTTVIQEAVELFEN